MISLKNTWKCFSVLTLAAASMAGPLFAEDVPTKENETVDVNKVSEAFGNFIGRNLKSSGLNLDVDSFVQGIRNGINGKPSPMTDKEYEKAMMLLQEQTFKRLAEDNLKAANAFLEKNAKEKGVVEIEPDKLQDKLQYLIVKQGSGNEVKEGDSPQIQYTGKYLDGTVFGSSQDTGGPITIPLNQTIPGFAKGLMGMKEGEVRKIFVHPDLGYGKAGHLPPNSLLIFEVELVKANSPDKAKLSKDSDSDDDDDDDDEDDDEEEEKAPAKAEIKTPVKK
jgi:FKBP-type peptidyl-prolyl cis-trans isomerase